MLYLKKYSNDLLTLHIYDLNYFFLTFHSYFLIDVVLFYSRFVTVTYSHRERSHITSAAEGDGNADGC